MELTACLADKTFSSSFDVNLATATEINAILIKNPAGSGKYLIPDHLFIALSNTISAGAVVRVYRNPTITSDGTNKTVINGWVASNVNSVIQVYALPTILVRGTQLLSFVAGSPLTGADGSPYKFDGSLVLSPGNSLLISATPDGTNRNLLFTLKWLESA